MPYRSSRSAGFGLMPFIVGKSCNTTITQCRRGTSVNIPVVRSGGARTTGGLPGTKLISSAEKSPKADQLAPAQIPAGTAEGLPNSSRFRPGQLDAFKQACWGY